MRKRRAANAYSVNSLTSHYTSTMLRISHMRDTAAAVRGSNIWRLATWVANIRTYNMYIAYVAAHTKTEQKESTLNTFKLFVDSIIVYALGKTELPRNKSWSHLSEYSSSMHVLLQSLYVLTLDAPSHLSQVKWRNLSLPNRPKTRKKKWHHHLF